MESVKISLTYLDSPLAFLLAVTGCAALSFISYLRFFKGLGKRYIGFLCFLRFAALFIALLIILKPVLRYQKIIKQERRLAVLVDTSRSMGIMDSVGGESRLSAAKRICSSPLLDDLKKAFTVETYAFGDNVRGYSPGVVPNSERTDLNGALRRVSGGSIPLACTLLLTDGGDTGTRDVMPPVTPVWAVPLGSGHAVWNLSARAVKTEPIVLVDNQATIEVAVEIMGEVPVGKRVKAGLVFGSRELDKQEIELKRGNQRIQFKVVPGKTGLISGKIVIESPSGEAFSEDNTRHFFLNVVKEKLLILLYEPSPRWESKFVIQSLKRDRDLQLVSVLRTAPSKLTIQGESPVALEGGLPASKKDFQKISVVILGDVTRGDLLSGQGKLLSEYVSDGGGLVVMGGRKNLSPGFIDADVQRILPAISIGPVKRGALGVHVVSSIHPVLRGLLPLLLGGIGGRRISVADVVQVGSIKPGAETILSASLSGSEEKYPLLLVQRFGKGRVAVVATSSTWTWPMRYGGAGGKELHERFWGQLARWSAGRKEGKKKAKLNLSKRVLNAGEEIIFSAYGTGGEKPTVKVSGPGNHADLVLSGSPSRKEASFRPSVPGRYEVSLSGVENKEIFYVEPNPVERDVLKPLTGKLYRLTQATGGGLAHLHEIKELSHRIFRSFPGVLQEVEETPEKNPSLFLVFVALVCLEWYLRRRKLTV